jgi:hypothetical protein
MRSDGRQNRPNLRNLKVGDLNLKISWQRWTDLDGRGSNTVPVIWVTFD